MGENSVLYHQKNIRILTHADVLVVGGGFGGVCAAIGAARAGAKVCLVEKTAQLGGQAAEIHTWGLDGFVNANGKQIIKGIPFEILKRTVREGGSDPLFEEIDLKLANDKGLEKALEKIGRTELMPYASSQDCNNSFNDNYVNPHAYRYTCYKMCCEENVEVFLDSPVIDTLHTDKNVYGIVIQGIFEKFAITAKRIVDTSQNAVVCANMGINYPFPTVYMHSHIQISGVDIFKMIEYIRNTDEEWKVRPMLEKRADPDEMKSMAEKGCTLFIHGFRRALDKAIEDDKEFEILRDENQDYVEIFYENNTIASPFIRGGNINSNNPEEYSDMILLLRKKQWLTYKFYKNYVPGCENIILSDVCPNVPKAYQIAVEGSGITEYEVSGEEIKNGKTNCDCIAAILKGHPGYGQCISGWQLPLKSMTPKEADNVLITGKPAHRFIHYNVSCAMAGQGAGICAAVSAKNNTPLLQTDTIKIEEELQRQQ